MVCWTRSFFFGILFPRFLLVQAISENGARLFVPLLNVSGVPVPFAVSSPTSLGTMCRCCVPVVAGLLWRPPFGDLQAPAPHISSLILVLLVYQ